MEILDRGTFLDSMIDESPNAMWISDARGILIRINRACCDLLRIAPADVIGRYNILEDNIVAAQGGMPLVRSVFEQGTTVSFELDYDTARLQIVPIGKPTRVMLKVTIFAIHDARGRVTNAVVQHVDLTEQRKAEAALQESASTLEGALSSMTDAVFISDVDGRFTHFNEAYATFHRFRTPAECPKTLAGYLALLEVFLGKGVPAPPQRWAVPRALRGETASNVEYTLRRRDTGETWIGCFSFGPIRDRGGTIVGSVVVARDVTESRRSESALQESEQRFRALVDGAPEGIFVQSDGRITFVNPSMVSLLGAKRPEDLLGAQFMTWVAPEYRDLVSERVRQQRETGQAVPPAEQDYLRIDGSRVPVEVTAVALPFQGSGAHLVFVRDRTARRNAAAAQESLRSQLLQAQKMESIGRLAAGVAHDFNNILMVQKGYCEVIKRSLKGDDPLCQHLLEIERAADRAAALTQQLLAFSRKQALAPRNIDLNVLVTNLDQMLRRLIGEDIELLTVSTPRPAIVRADPGQVEQVLVNLAVNARDAMPDGGKLTIEVAEVDLDETYADSHVGVIPGGHVMLAVSDTGCGMDEEVKRHLFEPFFTTKGEGHGTGLGLSTVYGIVQQSGGSVWVYSEPSRGTTFKVYLPRVDAAPAPLPAEETAPIHGNGELVLVIEDEPALRGLAKLVIERLGYRVVAAENGGAALIRVEEEGLRPDVILTDVVMPGMNGRVLVERLSRTLPSVKVIYMSGYTDDAVLHHGIHHTGVGFLQKPFSISDLAAALEAAFDSR
jgi:two-component system, cell cycle sensor histidine kinase and response regulator CckA